MLHDLVVSKSLILSTQWEKLLGTPLCNSFHLFTYLLSKEYSKGATLMHNGSSWLFTRLPFEQKYKTMNRPGNEIKELNYTATSTAAVVILT